LIIHQQIDKENVAYIHNAGFFSVKKQNYAICREMNRNVNYHVKYARLRKTNTACFPSYAKSRCKQEKNQVMNIKGVLLLEVPWGRQGASERSEGEKQVWRGEYDQRTLYAHVKKTERE
jgi:hypothetical protein